jgi:hypothetical protein
MIFVCLIGLIFQCLLKFNCSERSSLSIKTPDLTDFVLGTIIIISDNTEVWKSDTVDPWLSVGLGSKEITTEERLHRLRVYIIVFIALLWMLDSSSHNATQLLLKIAAFPQITNFPFIS